MQYLLFQLKRNRIQTGDGRIVDLAPLPSVLAPQLFRPFDLIDDVLTNQLDVLVAYVLKLAIYLLHSGVGAVCAWEDVGEVA